MRRIIRQVVFNGRGFERYGREPIEQVVEIIDDPTHPPVAVDRNGNVIRPTTFGLKSNEKVTPWK